MQQLLDETGIPIEWDRDASQRGLQRNVFHWIGFDDPFKEVQSRLPGHKTITAVEVAQKHGVPRNELEKFIKMEIEEASMFQSLPTTFLFVVAYAIMCVVHDDAEVVRSVEGSVRFAVDETANYAFYGNHMGFNTLDDVNSAADFWSWTKKGLIPLLYAGDVLETELAWNVSNAYEEPYAKQHESYLPKSEIGVPSQRGFLLNYNRIVAGMRFTLQKSKPIKCKSSQLLLKFWNRPCYGPAYEIDPETWTARAKTIADNVTWFYVWEDVSALQNRLMVMEAQGWLDESVEKVTISIPLYNAEFGLHTLFDINCFFSRGGSMWKQHVPLSSFARWWTYPFYVVYDIIWLLGLVHILRSEFKEVMWYCKHRPCSALYNEYFGFWNVVDWFSIISGSVIVALAALCFSEMSDCNTYLTKIPVPGIMPEPAQYDDYQEKVDKYMKHLQSVVSYVARLKVVLATYPMIIIFRLFKAFSAQKRLAIVTDSLYVIGVDFFHFTLIFLSIFVTLGVAGQILFGRGMASFTTFPRALNTVFRMMLLDFDWESFGKNGVSNLEAGVFVMITVTILNLIFLNMTLSIVMDGYSMVKMTAISGDTLFTEITQLIMRFYYERYADWVPLVTVRDALMDLEHTLKKRDRDAREARKAGRTSTKADSQTIVGRDTKCVPGLRVIPVDEDIASFVGEGIVQMVSVRGDRVRVLHVGRDGEGNEGPYVREYDIGHDLNFELKLVPGEDIVEFDTEDDSFTSDHEVISPARLMKVVREYDPRAYISHTQCLQLCVECVRHYYKTHCEDVDMDQLMQLMRKLKFRLKHMDQLIKDGSCQALSTTAVNDLPHLQECLTKLFTTVDEEREQTHSQIHEMEKDVKELKEQLKKDKPLEHHAHTHVNTVAHHRVKAPSVSTASRAESELPANMESSASAQTASGKRVVPFAAHKRRDFGAHVFEVTQDEVDAYDDDQLIADIDLLLKETAAAAGRPYDHFSSGPTWQRSHSGISLDSIGLEDSETHSAWSETSRNSRDLPRSHVHDRRK